MMSTTVVHQPTEVTQAKIHDQLNEEVRWEAATTLVAAHGQFRPRDVSVLGELKTHLFALDVLDNESRGLHV